MNFNDFLALVEHTKEIHPVWFGLEPDEVPNQEDIAVAEQNLGIKFPQDYKDFLREYGGGYFGLGKVFSLQQGSDWNVIDINLNLDYLSEGYLAISDDGAGDYFAYKIIENVCQPNIYFFDHEENKWELTEYFNLFDYLKKYALTN